MTREDAIYWIKNLAVLATEKDMTQIEEALNMAIEALADRKTEPQRNMAEDIVRSFDFKAESYRQAKAKDEPQTDCSWK